MKIIEEAIRRIVKESNSRKDCLSGHNRWGRSY